MTDDSNTPSPVTQDFVLSELAKTLSQVGFKLAVMELAMLQAVEGLTGAARVEFEKGFTRKAEEMMQRHAGLLMPTDDVEILRTVARIQAAARRA